MLLSITSGVFSWLSQVTAIINNRLGRMQPEQYAIGLIFCIGIGWILLRGRS